MCGGALQFQTAIEVGHIFKFGTRYSEPLGATFLDEDGTEKPLVGGSYGVGPARGHGRCRRAAPRRERDRLAAVDRSLRRPRASPCTAAPRRSSRAPRSVAAELDEAGLDVLLDDREERPGEKFADADLIGCPVRVTVGKKTLDDGAVDVRDRDGSAEERVAVPTW